MTTGSQQNEVDHEDRPGKQEELGGGRGGGGGIEPP